MATAPVSAMDREWEDRDVFGIPHFLAKRRLLLGLLAVVLLAPVSAAAEQDLDFGTWAMGEPAPGHLLATHATLLRNGTILVVGGSSYNCCFSWGMEEARVYNIAGGTWSAPLPSPAPYGPDRDAFCSGHAHDHLGGVIFQGGLHSYEKNGHGIPDSARYDLTTGAFSPISGAEPHWYPTLVTGVNATWLFPGVNTQLPPKTPKGSEIHKLPYGDTQWSTTGLPHETLGTYPRVTLLPDGRLFIASPAAADRKNDIFDPDTASLSPAGDDVVPESASWQVHGTNNSWKGTAVLLPLVPQAKTYTSARVALINGIGAYVKDPMLASPQWQPMGTRPPELGNPSPQRTYANATLLPTGQVFVSGGVEPPEHEVDAVKTAEVYDPALGQWLATAPASVARNYHAVALLLPDGRVWTASGSQDHSGSECGDPCNKGGPEKTEERVEIFTPWYVKADRPAISSCPSSMVADGRSYQLAMETGGRARGQVERVVLIRPGSVTHSFDTDQRFIELDVASASAGSVTFNAPYSVGAAPPGDYLLFALRRNAREGFRQWVPSKGCWTRMLTQRYDGASIWRYTGTPCNGQNCPGWQRLDNNHKTMSISGTGSHHHQLLYQLHNDGWIWKYLNQPCSGESCPGWRRLDNNSKTTAIEASGDNLYQLHYDGWIWRHTGTPCTGDLCPGWQRLDNNRKTVTIAGAGSDLYQLHNDGAIWRFTGTPCSGDSCPGWQRLDNNWKTVAIAVAGTHLYQLHHDGWIWKYTGTVCSGDSCPGWQRLDNNSKTDAIFAAGGDLYQLHHDGWIWKYTGTPCSGDACPGWQRLDNNSRTVALTSSNAGLYQQHVDGRIWRYTGTPCDGDACPGWQQLDNNPRNGMIDVSDTAMTGSGDHLYQLHSDPLYQLHNDGWIWRYTGTACDAEFCPGWQRVDNNARTKEIVAEGRELYQRHSNGEIWRYLGVPCSGDSCPGWQRLDNNPRTKMLAAGTNQFYQLHDNGAIWVSTGQPCSGDSCPGWQRLDNNRRTVSIAAANRHLYQLHEDGAIWRFTGRPCDGDSCPGWQRLDNNPRTTAIAAGGNQLYQLHQDGKIWRHTKTPCTGDSCPGWQLFDNNPRTRAIAAGGNQLYQLHSDGAIWRSTGKPCVGSSCPHWERLDNNPRTRDITAMGAHLYQRHEDGRIWKYTGPPCSGDSCPGWRLLDNNPKTIRITTGGRQ